MSYFSTIITKRVISRVLLFFVLFSYFSLENDPEVRRSAKTTKISSRGFWKAALLPSTVAFDNFFYLVRVRIF